MQAYWQRVLSAIFLLLFADAADTASAEVDVNAAIEGLDNLNTFLVSGNAEIPGMGTAVTLLQSTYAGLTQGTTVTKLKTAVKEFISTSAAGAVAVKTCKPGSFSLLEMLCLGAVTAISKKAVSNDVDNRVDTVFSYLWPTEQERNLPKTNGKVFEVPPIFDGKNHSTAPSPALNPNVFDVQGISPNSKTAVPNLTTSIPKSDENKSTNSEIPNQAPKVFKRWAVGYVQHQWRASLALPPNGTFKSFEFICSTNGKIRLRVLLKNPHAKMFTVEGEYETYVHLDNNGIAKISDMSELIDGFAQGEIFMEREVKKKHLPPPGSVSFGVEAEIPIEYQGFNAAIGYLKGKCRNLNQQ